MTAIPAQDCIIMRAKHISLEKSQVLRSGLKYPSDIFLTTLTCGYHSCQCVSGKLSNKWLSAENINGFIQFKLHTFCQQISSFRNQPLTGSLDPHIEQLVADQQNPFN